MGLDLKFASYPQLRAVYDDFGFSAMGVSVRSPSFGCVGDGVTDDTVAIQSAVAEARTRKLPLIFPPGLYKFSETLVLDWNYIQVIGWNAMLLPTAACTTAIYIGPGPSGSNQEVWLRGLALRGTANFGDNQTLIKFHNVSGKRIRLSFIQLLSAKLGLHSRGCDYTLLEQLFVKGCQTGWLASEWTNVAKAVGCAFAGKNEAGTATVTDKHMHFQGVDSVVLETCECGDGNYGIYADNITDNSSVTLIGHRNERVAVSDVLWGTGASGLTPNFLTIENSVFMGAAGESGRNIIDVNGGSFVNVRNSRGVQVGANHRLVKARTSGSKIVVENCAMQQGSVFENASGVTSSDRLIVQGW